LLPGRKRATGDAARRASILYTYRNLLDAKAHSGPRNAVVESLGQVWMYTIAARNWRPAAGPEAWYVLAGVQCLETPDGITVVRAGESALVPEGPPMMLSSVGTETRRSVLLVLHDSSKPWITPEMQWKAEGLVSEVTLTRHRLPAACYRDCGA